MQVFIINTSFIDAVSLRHVSALRGSSSGSATVKLVQEDQRNETPDIKIQSSEQRVI